jgi:hypothetical protein
MKWKHPPIIKIYEALGSVADGRLEVSGNTAKVWSSSGNKAYEVTYDPDSNAIMANDNGSYWKGYLGYPSIAFLIHLGVLEYSDTLAKLLQGIAWKDINQKFKNDFDKTLAHILAPFSDEDREELSAYAARVDSQIQTLGISMLGTKIKPPEGY